MIDPEQELYDEFGNYIGPDLDSDDDDDDESQEEQEVHDDDDASVLSGGESQHQPQASIVTFDESNTADPMNAIVLHEDKVHYPSAQEIYGEEVRTAVLDEDAMDLSVPIVEPVLNQTNRAKSSRAELSSDEEYIYSDSYLTSLMGNDTATRIRRGFALVGHLHAGKTSFVDMLLETTKRLDWGERASLDVPNGGGPRYTDLLESEQAREMSLVSTPVTTILSDTRGKSYIVTLVDCPGHVNFHDESVAAMRAMDGAVLVIDAVEGIMLHTEMVVRHAVSEGLPITLLINKVDRLIVELKLPPRDCYFKLLNLVESVNDLVGRASQGRYPKISPELGNVAFASAQHGWCFTLKSFAQLYLDHLCEDGLGDNIGIDEFAKRLWGNCYLDLETRNFYKNARACSFSGVQRTFVTYVLDPLYKIYSACLAEREHVVNKLLRSVGVLLHRDELRASARTLLRTALSKFFQTAICGFVEMTVQHL
jgi:116 kDa U5 small nuclear ribonucleoprotein component